LSDDGQYGLSIIAFVGSVFSPYYARARRKGLGHPENFCAVNVALYGPQKRWAMTERGVQDVRRDATQFVCGPSSLRIDGDVVTITLHERSMPVPRAIAGVVRVSLKTCYDAPVALDDAGLHQWRAVAPHARVEVELSAPVQSWQGNCYHDMNWGAEPIEKAFKDWTWSRLHDENGAVVFYDARRRDDSRKAFALGFSGGIAKAVGLPPSHALSRGFWGMAQDVRSEKLPVIVSKLEDAPFYTRNLVRISHGGKSYDAFQESLSVSKFDTTLVQMMLPFKMPRWSKR
jgi:carotenoid 1,2-hydratase